ncbi:hypothetical protein K474DRAFT_1665258 [Panus rudis PR-1116 ss-1]|nr:hypothetical protein K474DRAFT_1665258 [Panus rudis PR-1116 ss-1]
MFGSQAGHLSIPMSSVHYSWGKNLFWTSASCITLVFHTSLCLALLSQKILTDLKLFVAVTQAPTHPTLRVADNNVKNRCYKSPVL